MKEFKLSKNTIDFLISSLEESIMEEETLQEIISEVLNVDDINDIELVDYINETPLEISLEEFVLEIVRKVETFLETFKGEKGWIE